MVAIPWYSRVEASGGASASTPSGQRIAPYAWCIMVQAFITSGGVCGLWFSFAVFCYAMVQAMIVSLTFRDGFASL